MATKVDIQNSFIKLLYEKPFDKITIKDISDASFINRNTFYYHYGDINELVVDILKSRFEKLGEEAIHMNGFKNQCSYIVNWFKTFKEPILNVYNSYEKATVDKYVYNMAKIIADEFVKAGYYSRGVRGKTYKTVREFYIALTYGYILMILDHNIPDDIEESLNHLFKTMGPMIDYSVETLTGIRK